MAELEADSEAECNHDSACVECEFFQNFIHRRKNEIMSIMFDKSADLKKDALSLRDGSAPFASFMKMFGESLHLQQDVNESEQGDWKPRASRHRQT